MPGGKLQKKPSNGQGRPKRKKGPKPVNWNKSGSTAAMRKNDLLGGRGPMQSAPAAQARVIKTRGPRMTSMRNGDCRVVHREYIQDITANTGSPSNFQATQFALNPGQVATFPWLSSVAKNFESYRFKKLKFCYETEAPSSLGGSAVLSIDYDATDAAPTTKQQAMAYRNAVRSAPWEPSCHTSDIEDLNKQKSYFVRPGPQPPNTDIKTYDTGNMFVCTQNVTTASAVCGELYVEYDVELLTPVYENSVATSGTMAAAAGTVASPLLAGVAAGAIGISQALTIMTLTGLVVGQEYLIDYQAAGAYFMTFGTYVGLTVVNYGGGGNGQANTNTVTVTATATTGSFAITAAGAPGKAQLIVAQLPSNAGF